MREVRGIDLDEVLFETIEGVLDFHNHTFNGIHVTKDDISDYHYAKIEKFNMDEATAAKTFHDFWYSEKASKIQPVMGARNALEKLKAKAKSLVAITGRLEEYRELTQKSLDLHYPQLIEKVVFVNTYSKYVGTNNQTKSRTKSDVCKELGVTVMVEDDLDYAYELANNGINVYLFDKPWNEKYHKAPHPRIVKISGREELPI